MGARRYGLLYYSSWYSFIVEKYTDNYKFTHTKFFDLTT